MRARLLAVGATLGVLCVLSALAGALLGVTPLVFRSGSMSPAIPAGALALSRSTPATDLRVGDVVSVEDASGTRVTHRVTALTRDGDAATLVLQGDANPVPDAAPVTVRDADRVLVDLPYAGYGVAAVSGPVGIFVGGMLSGVLLVIAFGPSGRRDDDRQAGRRVAVAAAATAAVVVTGGAVPSTLAAFTDAATATTSIGATTVLRPDSIGCSGATGNSVVTWPHKSLDYSYTYTVTRVSNGAASGSGTTTTTGAVGSTVSQPFTTGLLNGTLLGNVAYDVAVTSVLKDSPTWASATTQVQRVHTQSLVVGLSIQCGDA